MAPLKVWELQDLSMQAAAQILSNSKLEQLNAFEEISQNFPSHARTLSRTKIPKDMKKEIKKNNDQFYGNHGITPKDAMLFINGMQYDMEYVDIFTLLDVVKSESSILDGLGKLGLKEENAAKMLSIDFSKKDSEKFGVDIRSSAVHWIKKNKKDKLYKGWPSSVQELLRPTFPGMLRSIRKNFFNVILVCDPSNKESREMIRKCAVNHPFSRRRQFFILAEPPLPQPHAKSRMTSDHNFKAINSLPSILCFFLLKMI